MSRPMKTLLFALLTLAACGGTEGVRGDPPSEPVADVHGGGHRISEVVGPATWFDENNEDPDLCQSPADYLVNLTGLSVVAIDAFDEENDGYLGNIYVQDAVDNPPPYSGITAFEPSFSPPDLRVADGDVVDVQGLLQEFGGTTSSPFDSCKTLPEIGGTLAFRYDGKPVTPVTVPLSDLANYETARPWLGMLIRVENVKASTDPEQEGNVSVKINVGGGVGAKDVPQISSELYDIRAEGPTISAGTTFKSITGVLTFFYQFKLAPRSPADFEL